MLQPGESVLDQVSIAVKPSIQIGVAFYRVTLSRNYGFGTLLFNLFPYGLTVIALVRNERLRNGTLAIRLGACVKSLIWSPVISNTMGGPQASTPR